MHFFIKILDKWFFMFIFDRPFSHKIMSPRTAQQIEEIRKDRKQAIMDTALEEFASQGYESTSISTIAKKAGVSKGLMYNYFDSKEDLLINIIHDQIHLIHDQFDENHDGSLSKAEFLSFIKKSIRIIKNNPDYWKLYTQLAFQPQVINLIENRFEDLAKNYTKLVYELFANNNIKDIEGELLVFNAVIKGATIQYLAYPDVYPIDKIENKLLEVYDKILDK